MAPGRCAQLRAGAADAGLEPAGRRPRRPGLPHRAVRAGGPGDLERQLVRRPLHPHLQRPLPAAGGAAGPAGGGDARGRLLLLPLRPPGPRPLGGGGALGDPLVRRRRRHPARRRPADLRPRGRLRPRLAALPADRARRRSRSSPPRPAPWPARSPAPSSPASSSPGRSNPASAPAASRSRSPASRWPSPSSPTSPSRSRASSPSSSPPTSRSRSGAAGALFVIRGLPEERQLRRVLVGYVLASTVIWLAPNAMGGNAVRLGALFGGPVLAAVVLARRPPVATWFVALAMVGGLYWQLTASVTQIARWVGDPSTTAEYFQPASAWLRAHGGEGMRIEVPPTANHWESAYLAPELRARPRLAAPARHHPRRHLLRPGRADRRRLQLLAAPQRDLLRRPPRRPARLLLARPSAA